MTDLPEYIVHERYLLGAVDSFLGTIVHVRPHLAADLREHLEHMAETFIEAGHPNQIEALNADWLHNYLAQVEDRAAVENSLREFFRWALQEHLITASPLA
jgi:hypothetical protein